MKKLLLTLAALCGFASVASADLIITGVFDGNLTGGLPKGVELYATTDITDITSYGFGSANNGGGTDGAEFKFGDVTSGSIAAGTFIYITSDIDAFSSFFGVSENVYESGSANINGDDALEVFFSSDSFGSYTVQSLYGDVDVDGNDANWDYTDSWVYLKSNTVSGSTFDVASWSFGEFDDGSISTNALNSNPMPIGTYTFSAAAIPEPSTYALIFGSLAIAGFIYRRRKQAK